MTKRLTVVLDSDGYTVTTSCGTTLARSATEAAMAVLHTFSTFGESLDNGSTCPFCRDAHYNAHGYGVKNPKAGKLFCV